MGTKLSKAPVYYALANIKFNPVGAIAKYVDEIQEPLRKSGYPRLEERKTTELQLQQDKDQRLDVSGVEQKVMWFFARRDYTAGYALGASALSFYTTDYEAHQSFFKEMLAGLKAVHDAVALDHIQRIGLRYLNMILPNDNLKLEDYIVSGLGGKLIPEVPEFQLQRSMSEHIFQTRGGPLAEFGTLVGRAYKHTAKTGFPPNLTIPPKLSFPNRFRLDKPTEHVVLDMDHYVETEADLDIARIEQQLANLHEGISTMFNAATTGKARLAWA